ncbi:uncharacterized protein EI90DRAFT_259517 [Cantharellus anzutake]|uniref:uncharacterized protein n=1 Tax=Cantharellus anzutake TaxID=1750568 RepID=UPI00190434C1|nr:uncharacterized protein EI90DRAFT_259517 [Cantharellus anzutake]KAF8335797.1 hypothetical protein EI90DRAFT_259517 [Cantharellus anzutake]
MWCKHPAIAVSRPGTESPSTSAPLPSLRLAQLHIRYAVYAQYHTDCSMHARRPFSPPTPAQHTASGGLNTKLVNKLVIRGSIGEHASFARIQIFAKISIPEFPPSQAYPLFQESHTKLLRSECHPLSPDGAPYALPPNVSRLMQHALRALALPPPLPVSYPDLLSPLPNASHYKTNGGQNLTSDMTGFITVNNYEYCYLSPRILVPPSNLRPQSAGPIYKHRRNSIGVSVRDGILSFHIVAMELEVPLVSTPPAAPYMLNVPLPRCLHNSIKFKIHLPSVLTRSAASDYSSAGSSNVSVEEQWSARTIPALFQRKRQHSTASTENWADQESRSDVSSSNSVNSLMSAGPPRVDQKPRVIEGKFMSSDRIIIRWAPARNPSFKALRHDIAAQRVESVLKCTIGSPIIDSARPVVYPVDLEFDAKCFGLLDPHVETELGLPVVVDTFGSTARWSAEYDPDEDKSPFEVTGGEGVGQWSWKDHKLPLSLVNSLSKVTENTTGRSGTSPTRSSQDAPSQPRMTPSRIPIVSNSVSKDRVSLLRAPLPGPDSPVTPVDATFDDDELDDDDISSVPDGYFSTGPSSRRSSMNSAPPDIVTKPPRHPADPFKIHIDILPLLPNSPNSPAMSAHFRLTTKLLLSGSTLDPHHIALPAVRIPSAETHLCECIIRSKNKDSEIIVSAPDADVSSKRSHITLGGAKGSSLCQWTVEVSAKPWSESSASTSGDMWGGDCLLLVVPETKKQIMSIPKTLRTYSSRMLTSPLSPSPTPSSSNGDESPGMLTTGTQGETP